MKTKIKPKTRRRSKLRVPESRERITNTTMSAIGRRIGKMLDIINDPQYKDENFRQILNQSENRFFMAASNEDVFISVTFEWKGAAQ